ncbi:MAG: dual specificity protein phosphatase family protein [Cyanobacteria bacterium SBLK]|nr:dual specificity protein phosphatase family protein [Cyanobacteria bacterium SBLK]
MKYGLLFFTLGLVLSLSIEQFPDLQWLLIWLSLDFLWVGSSYLGLGAQMLGKRSRGQIAIVHLIFLMPYFLFTWMIWRMQTFLSQEEACTEIIPGIWLGRRISSAKELPNNIDLVVDLTAEFSEPRDIRSGRHYICVPILDGFIPRDRIFNTFIHNLSSQKGNIYIHCALGHGRSAMVMVALLKAKGKANTIEEAEDLISNLRPHIRLNYPQKQLLKRFFLSFN